MHLSTRRLQHQRCTVNVAACLKRASSALLEEGVQSLPVSRSMDWLTQLPLLVSAT
jgi:hypothetical protein